MHVGGGPTTSLGMTRINVNPKNIRYDISDRERHEH